MIILLALAVATLSLADLPMTDLSGEPRPLAEHRGRIVVLDFWATWCAPCVKALPELADLQRRFGHAGVDVIAVSVDEPALWSEAARVLEREAPGVALRVGPTMSDVERLTGAPSIPATVVVDDDGSVASRISGPVDPEKMVELMDWLTGDREDPRPGDEDPGPGEPGKHEGHEEDTRPRKGESLVPS